MDICITGTGFRGSAREDIRRLAELLGMEFNGALVRDRTTHLILASEALLCEDIPRSQKLDSAKCWGIALTHYAWLKDSLAMGKILDAQKYIVQNSPDRCVLHGRGAYSDAWTPEQLRAAQIPPAQRCDQFWSPGQASSGPGDEDAQSSGHSARHSERSMGRTVVNAIPSVQDLCLSSATVNEERYSMEVCSERAVPRGTACSKSYSASGQSYTSSEGYGQSSPEIMRVSVDAPLKICPKGSTAAAFHGVSNRSLTYYEKLTIQQSSSSPPLHFDLRERSHGALVYYEDSNSGEHELAYADILYCYSLEGGEVYIEHGYLFDRDDLEQHAMGRLFLESFQLADAELVDSSGVYHSPATVIEGGRTALLVHVVCVTLMPACRSTKPDLAGSQDQERLLFFCEKAWERRTGRGICVSRYKLKSRKQFIRG